MNSEAIIVATDVGRVHSDPSGAQTIALDGIDLKVHAGELVAIVGPSGSGKSTLLQILGALDSPTSGTVDVDGLDISHASEAERTEHRRRSIGFIFQAFHLVPSMTVVENVALAAIIGGAARRDWHDRALEVLTELDMIDTAERLPHRISGGQRQRAAIGRALFSNPAIILADEPTGNLDATNSAAVLSILREAITDRRRSCGVLVTHDLEAAGVADRVILLRNGAIAGELDLRDISGRTKENDAERIRHWLATTEI